MSCKFYHVTTAYKRCQEKHGGRKVQEKGNSQEKSFACWGVAARAMQREGLWGSTTGPVAFERAATLLYVVFPPRTKKGDSVGFDSMERGRKRVLPRELRGTIGPELLPPPSENMHENSVRASVQYMQRRVCF